MLERSNEELQHGGAPIQAAEDKLREREQILRAIFDGALDGMLLLDDARRYVDANPAACELLGHTKEELLGRTYAEIASSDQALASETWAALDQQGHLRGEVPLTRPDGTRRTLEFSAAANIIPGLHLWVLRDVTERKRHEEALRETRYFLEEAEALAQVGCWVAPEDPDGPVFWTKESYRIAGVPEGTPMTANQFFTLVHPDDQATVRAALEAALARSAPYEVFENVAEGAPLRIIGTVQDITERRAALAQLGESEARYRRIVETTSEGVWELDAGFLTTFVNQRMADMVGYSRDEMIGLPARAFFTEAGRAVTEATLARRRQGVSETYETSVRRKDGSALWVLVRSNAIIDDDGRFMGTIGLMGDMTERRKSEEARNRLAAIVESSGDAIISKTLDGSITTWNPAAERLFGYSAEEIVGRPVTVLIPPDREDEEPAFLARLAAGRRVEHYDTVRRRKDGSLVEVSLELSPITDAEGRVVGASKIAHDITARRKQETALRRSEEQLRQAQKMEAIGSLAGGIAHDFNNILSVILSYTELLIDDHDANDPVRADLDEIHKAGNRAADLTRQLLAFSRQQLLEPKVLDLNRSIVDIQKMLGRMLGEDVVLSLQPSPEIGRVYADAGQIEQVLMNLVVNARDAMPRGGNLTIETSNVVLAAEQAAQLGGLTPGSYVLLAVTDTGTGMDQATRERIFDPFFTTKETGKGTGLGLSTVYGIVQQSGGHIAVHSTVGVGTTFEIYLPRTDREAEDDRSLRAPGTLSYRGSETILLVEDEDQVRAVMRSILRKQGYHVLEAQNGGEAFLISEQFAETIHMLLTDVVMPRMSGRVLAERLQPQRPEMKVLYVSGYTRDATFQHGVLDAGKAFLQKPVTPETLLKKVRESLDAAQ